LRAAAEHVEAIECGAARQKTEPIVAGSFSGHASLAAVAVLVSSATGRLRVTHTFVSDRVRLFIIWLFVALLFAPGFVMSLVDRFTNPHPPDVQAILSGLASVFGLGLLWSMWLSLPPIAITGTTMLERRAFTRRRISLEHIKRMKRLAVTRHRTRIDDLTLFTTEDRVLTTIDLVRVRDADALVALLRNLTGAAVEKANR